jgi:hypothetical protein
MEVVDTLTVHLSFKESKKIVMDGWFVYNKTTTPYLPAICDGEGATPMNLFLIKGHFQRNPVCGSLTFSYYYKLFKVLRCVRN